MNRRLWCGPAIVAVAVFGSVARGEEDKSPDGKTDDASKAPVVAEQSRLVSFEVFVVDFALKKNDAAGEAKGQQAEADAPQLTGTVDQVMRKLAPMIASGEITTVRKYRLKVQEQKKGEVSFMEVKPMVQGFTMNASTRVATPTLSMRDTGTMISVKPTISENEISVDMMVLESKVSPQESWIELAKGENGPIYSKGITTMRLLTTLTMASGQTSMALATRSDQATCAVILAAQIDEPAIAGKSDPGPAVGRPSTRSTPEPAAPGFGGGRAPSGRVPSLYQILRTDAAREKLKLTDEQFEKMTELRTELNQEFRNAASDPEKRSNMAAQVEGYEKKLLKVLTDEQKQIWSTWQEELKKEAEERRDRSRGAPRTPLDRPSGNPGF